MSLKKRLLFGLVALVGVVCLVYGYFAFWPTGFARFEKEHAGALISADQLVALAGTASLVDELSAIQDFVAPRPIDLDHYGLARWVGCSLTLPADGDAGLRRAERVQALVARGAASSSRDFTLDPFEAAHEVVRVLEPIERSLLAAPGRFPTFADFPNVPGIQNTGYFDYAALAILHTASGGRGEDATRMLVRFLDTLRVLHHGQFPRQVVRLDLARRLLLGLTRIESFPERGLDRAAEALRHFRLSPGQADDLRIAHTLRWREEFLHDLDDEAIPSRDNRWRGFAGGYPARIVSWGFKPIQIKSVDRTSLAWAERGMPFEPRWRHIIQPRYGGFNPLAVDYLSSIMRNQDQEQYVRQHRHYHLSRPVENRIDLVKHNGQVLWLELAFAVARYARHHGAYPDNIGQLVPGFLGADFLELQNVSLSSSRSAPATWSVARWEDENGTVIPVLERRIGAGLRFRRRGNEIQPRVGWHSARLDEVAGCTSFEVVAPDQPGTVSVVQVTFLLPNSP